MKCLSPRHLINKATRRSMWVACGRCSHCLENRRESWLFRLERELKFCRFGTHCTFQFDNDHLGDNILDKSDLQLLFKRLRKCGLDFSYYAIGEYGTRDKRKHFHVAFFVRSNISRRDFKSIVDSKWDKGFVFYTHLVRRNCAYVLHYHIRPKIVDGKKTFCLFSKGLGVPDDKEFFRFLFF